MTILRLTSVFALAGMLMAPTAIAAGRQLTGVYAPAATPPLAPDEAAKKMTLPDGFEARIFAFEPDVVNPVAMTWDERGRLWVVELYEYPLGAPAGSKPRDQVKILEDTNNDGRADKVTVFADGLNLATGVLLGYGGVFVGQAPHLLFLEDTDGDDKADKSTVLKTGFGLEDRHELLNGFTWGPDGYLYMTHGVFTFSKVKNPGDSNDDGVIMTAAVARYHPRNKKFEVFAEGTSNPWGVDFDRAGNAFVSACVIDHLFHMAPGGLYQRQAGSPPYPYAYETLPSIVDHKHFRAAYAGVQVYQGDQYPAEYQGTILMGNIHDSSVHQDRLTPNGSSFKASFIKDFVRANDGWFRPVSIQTGPDGAVWIMDWYDKYPCYQNANADPEGVDREHGRIWRIVYTGNEKGKPVPSHPAGLNLGKLSGEELVKTLTHPNAWHRRMAQRILSERADRSAREGLLRILRDEKGGDARIAAFWTLHSAGLMQESDLEKTSRDSDPVIRTWTARFLGERGNSTAGIFEILRVLARDDEAPVRLAALTAARQFMSGSLTVNTPPGSEPENGLGEVVAEAYTHPGSGTDPVIPFILWTAVEQVIAADAREPLDWLVDNAMSNPELGRKILRKIARRVLDTGSSQKLGDVLTFLSRLSPDAAPIAVGTLDGLIEGQKGRAFTADQQAKTVLAHLQKHPNKEVVSRAQQLGTLWGDAAALDASLRVISDNARTLDERIQAIQSVRSQKVPAVQETFARLVSSGDTPELVLNAALQGMGETGADNVPDIVLKQWKAFNASTRRTAAEVLASRSKWAQRLISAIETKSVGIGEVPVPVVRNLTTSKDDYVRNRAVAVIGKFRETSPDKTKLIAEKKQLVLQGAVDLRKGHEIAQRTCFTCHKLHGEGADVGPDLTGVGRSSLEALLANIIDPNQLIGAGYENVEVITKDDRSISGRLVENTDTRVKIVSAGPKEEVIAKSDIASTRVSEMSVMPEGLEQMPDEDFRNMVWYLLNPPQDAKPIVIYPDEKKLVVRAKAPGASEYAEIVTYVTDPASRPYLHPVKDLSGERTLTQNEPADHVWQHGIFTGLHKVNDLDFWTERQGKQRFVRMLDMIQEQDYVGWRSLTEWVRPDGQVEMEEEQFVKVYAPNGATHYNIDFDWSLRAKGETVKIGRYDYGGLAVRPDFVKTHSYLNSNGERDKSIGDQRAAWAAVSRPFGKEQYGVAVFDHPANPGHPALWRIDDFSFLNPSPSKQGDWTVDRHGRTFHYRLTVYRGAADAKLLDSIFKSYSALAFNPVAANTTDKESVALWNPEWKINAPDFEHSPLKLPEFAGRRNVLITHPYDEKKPSALERVVDIPAGQKTSLTFNVAAHDEGDWELRIFADDQLLQQQVVDRKGDRWKTVTVDLSKFAGRKVKLRLENAANNWSWEFGYWQDIRLGSL